MHPELKQPLIALCDDPKTTIVVLSGSGRKVLFNVSISALPCLLSCFIDFLTRMYSQNFKEYNMWLAAENGMFLRPAKGEWMTTMPEHLNMEWVDSVKVPILMF